MLLILLGGVHFTTAAHDQFIHWYDEFSATFEAVMQHNCTQEYEHYLHGHKVHNISTPALLAGAGRTNQLAQPVVACILSNISPYIASAMGSAQVLLGLTPTMLAVLGPSTEEVSVLFVVGRRPLLALCLAAGTPAVFPMRSFDPKDPLGILKERDGRLQAPELPRVGEVIVVLVQYVLTICAILNVADVSRQLGVQVVCNFAPQLTYLVLLWASLTLIIHATGSMALMFRVRVMREGSSDHSYGWFQRRFTLLNDRRRPVNTRLVPESYWFTFLSWFTAILTVCHVLFGTLVFSSMLFISVRDSLEVIARYMASVICCRIILMYELASLRNAFNADGWNGPHANGRGTQLQALPTDSTTHLRQAHTW